MENRFLVFWEEGEIGKWGTLGSDYYGVQLVQVMMYPRVMAVSVERSEQRGTIWSRKTVRIQ